MPVLKMADAKEAKGHGVDEKGYKDGWADENGGASEGKTAEAKDDGHDGGFGDSALDARRRHWPRAEPFCPVDGGALTRGIRLIACEPAATRGTELLVLSEDVGWRSLMEKSVYVFLPKRLS